MAMIGCNHISKHFTQIYVVYDFQGGSKCLKLSILFILMRNNINKIWLKYWLKMLFHPIIAMMTDLGNLGNLGKTSKYMKVKNLSQVSWKKSIQNQVTI